MKTLLAGLSILALSAGNAYATDTAAMEQLPTGSGGALSVEQAWTSSAFDKDPALQGPIEPLEPTVAEPTDPEVRKPSIAIRDARTNKVNHGKASASYVDQVGSDNQVETDQRYAGWGAISDVIQVGDNNTAQVTQRVGGGDDTGDYAVITSKGDGNNAVIDQFNNPYNNAGRNVADIRQGPDGAETIYQPDYADDNSASISQTGGGNLGVIDQYEGNGLFATANEARIETTGFINKANVDQSGDGNKASIDQDGNYGGFGAGGAFNSAQIDQDGDNHRGRIDQTGNRNKAQTIQSGNFGGFQAHPNTDGNSSFIDQNGDWNTALTDQWGSNNHSVIDQWGDHNMASITQEGWGNTSFIIQDGVGNMAASSQTGDWNMSAIDQSGHDNAAEVVQTGQNYADVQQHGYRNSAYVTQ